MPIERTAATARIQLSRRRRDAESGRGREREGKARDEAGGVHGGRRGRRPRRAAAERRAPSQMRSRERALWSPFLHIIRSLKSFGNVGRSKLKGPALESGGASALCFSAGLHTYIQDSITCVGPPQTPTTRTEAGCRMTLKSEAQSRYSSQAGQNTWTRTDKTHVPEASQTVPLPPSLRPAGGPFLHRYDQHAAPLSIAPTSRRPLPASLRPANRQPFHTRSLGSL